MLSDVTNDGRLVCVERSLKACFSKEGHNQFRESIHNFLSPSLRSGRSAMGVSALRRVREKSVGRNRSHSSSLSSQNVWSQGNIPK